MGDCEENGERVTYHNQTSPCQILSLVLAGKYWRMPTSRNGTHMMLSHDEHRPGTSTQRGWIHELMASHKAANDIAIIAEHRGRCLLSERAGA